MSGHRCDGCSWCDERAEEMVEAREQRRTEAWVRRGERQVEALLEHPEERR